MKALLISRSRSDAEPFTLALRLRWQDLATLFAHESDVVTELIEREKPDLVVLCGEIPNLSLEEAIVGVRRLSDVPIIVMREGNSEMEVIRAIELGADDFISLPCNPMILMARAAALLRRVGRGHREEPRAPLRRGPLVIDPVRYEAMLRGQPLSLTPTEFRLLLLLAKNQQLTLPQVVIQRELWSGRAEARDTLKKYIQRLRRKLGDNAQDPEWITTVHGVGYRFSAPASGVPTSAPLS